MRGVGFAVIVREMKSEKLKPQVRELEKRIIRRALKRFRTRTATAAALGITRETLNQKLK